jgi:hypothetical protein
MGGMTSPSHPRPITPTKTSKEHGWQHKVSTLGLIGQHKKRAFLWRKFDRVTLAATQVRRRKEGFVMISKEVGELIQAKMKDTRKMEEEAEKKNPSLDGQFKREIDATKRPK